MTRLVRGIYPEVSRTNKTDHKKFKALLGWHSRCIGKIGEVLSAAINPDRINLNLPRRVQAGSSHSNAEMRYFVPGKKHLKLLGYCSLIPLLFLGGCSVSGFPLLDPQGPIGHSEFNLIVTAFLIMLIPVLPVIGMTFWFAWRYRATRRETAPTPGWPEHKIELVVWAVPTVIVIALGVLTWVTTHRLDPYKSIASPAKPIQIEAIALNWKWLFIYPDEHIATVNQLVIPVNVPVNFRLTSDTVMASLFIPRLGSQVYAMAGMQTRLHLLASQPGSYRGMNSQFSGAGFPGMHFRVIASSQGDYQAWLKQVRQTGSALNLARFKQLAQPSAHSPVSYFASVQPPDLFDQVMRTFKPMQPGAMAPMQPASSH